MMRLYLFAVILFIGSCSIDYFSIYKNEKISDKERGEIGHLTDSVYHCFVTKQYDFLSKISNYDLKIDLESRTAFLKLMNCLDSPKKELLDQFLIKATPNKKLNNVSVIGDTGYSYLFYAKTKYTYIYFMNSYVDDNRSQWVITSIFNKDHESDKWQLGMLNYNFYKFNNKTALEYFDETKKKFEAGKILESYLDFHIVGNLSMLLEAGLHYNKENEMKEYDDKVYKAVYEQKLLPHEIKSITSKPQILNVKTIIVGGKLLPVIVCGSKYSINDSVKMRNEGFEISKSLRNYFPDIKDINDKCVFEFVALSEINTPNTPRYRFITIIK